MKIVAISPDLSSNASYTPWQFRCALLSQGHRVRFTGTKTSDCWPPLAKELQSSEVLPGRWGGLPFATQLLATAKDADAVYAFKALPTTLGLGFLVRQVKDIPLVLHLDDWDAGEFHAINTFRRCWYSIRGAINPQGDLWLRLLERRIPEADVITVSSGALKTRYGGELIRQGVDADKYSPHRYPRAEARDRIGCPQEANMVLFLGTPRPHKGLQLLLESWSQSEPVWLVGANAEALLRIGIAPDLLRNALVRGPVSVDEAAWYLSACDVFVIPQSATPYAQHQFPAKMAHAMAMGCAIVATEVGDASEILGGEVSAGIVVPANDGEAMCEAITMLLNDVQLRSRLGSEARRRAECELSWAAMGARLNCVLDNLH